MELEMYLKKKNTKSFFFTSYTKSKNFSFIFTNKNIKKSCSLTTTHPKISIIIPCYNYAIYLSDAIESILNQKFDISKIEIIIVDDGSTDNIVEVIERYKHIVRYFRQDNLGLSAARNTGLILAEGDFILFLDADDKLPSNYIASQLKFHETYQDIDISVTPYIRLSLPMSSNSKIEFNKIPKNNLSVHLCNSNISAVHAFLLKATAVFDIGFFDSDLKACEDYDYWIRSMFSNKHFEPNNETFVIYRSHDKEMSLRSTNQITFTASIYSKIFLYLKELKPITNLNNYIYWLAFMSGSIHLAYTTFSFPSSYNLINKICDAIYATEKNYNLNFIQGSLSKNEEILLEFYAISTFIDFKLLLSLLERIKAPNKFLERLHECFAIFSKQHSTISNLEKDRLTRKKSNLSNKIYYSIPYSFVDLLF